MVIDDDEGIQSLVQDALSSDYSISTAPDAEQGLDQLTREPFDLLILDLGLPGLGGVHVIRQLRELESHARLPILVISAYTELRRHVEGLDVDAVLAKPFSLRQLEHLVCKLLGSRDATSGTGPAEAKAA